jgi:CheY-like chemotaxis protein
MSTERDTTFADTLSRLRYDLRRSTALVIGHAEMMAEDIVDDEVLRDLQAIASSGERLVAMIEEHLGAAKRSIDELDLGAAQFQLRLQLNHISGYTEMLAETAEEDGRYDLFDDLGRIASAERQMLSILEDRLVPEAFEADRTGEAAREPTGDAANKSVASDQTLQLGALAQGGRLLVVDSDPMARDLLHRRLSGYGFDVVSAENGEVAYKMAVASTFDLIIMDSVMEGWSGLDTLRRLKATTKTRDIPVIILSAMDDLDQMVESVLAGADDYLISPIRPVLLLARIGASLEKVRLRRRFTRQLRIFISSPGDVIPERRLVKQLIQQLDEEYGHDVQLVPILWEEEPLVASETFQAQIIEPHDTDIYLAILWSRIGSPLPKTILRSDGSQYDSGTAYEFEDAMQSFREKGSPQMLMYRKTGAPVVTLDDRDEVMDRLDQMARLDRYINTWFRGDDGSYIGAFHQFADPEQLESMVSLHLRKLIDRWLADADPSR